MEKLETELHFLRSVKRLEVAEKLHEGLENVEDCEYLAARDEQAMVEGRIWELEQLLAQVEIIHPSQSDGIINLGSTVSIQQEGMSIEVYSIVGTAEAKPKEHMISNESPLGQALMGHKSGEEVEVKAPAGTEIFRILAVS